MIWLWLDTDCAMSLPIFGLVVYMFLFWLFGSISIVLFVVMTINITNLFFTMLLESGITT